MTSWPDAAEQGLRSRAEHSAWQRRFDVAVTNGALPCLPVGAVPETEIERALCVLGGGTPYTRRASIGRQPGLMYHVNKRLLLIGITATRDCPVRRFLLVRDVA